MLTLKVLEIRVSAGKLAPAPWNLAAVRPLAGVDTAVAGERTRVCKCLVTCLAVVWALAGVDASVHSQCRALDKCFPATTVDADEWPLICVDSEVTGEVAFARKSAVAVFKLADEWADQKVVAWSNLVGVIDKVEDVHGRQSRAG